MEIRFLAVVLFSFIVTFGISPFFIGLLYRFNIRRMSKADLADKLPDRAVKAGTPIMGGAVITFTALLVLILFLRDWPLFIPFAVILVLGSVFGAIDEFINTIGRKGFSFAVKEAIDSVVIKNRLAWEIYKLLLIPWDLFKEMWRIMGSTQGGLKTHEKFLMQFSLALIGSCWLYFVMGFKSLWLPLIGEIYLGPFYLIFMLFLAVGYANAFGVTDGMDGLSAGLHIISFLAYGTLALILGESELALFCAALVGSELAFLYFNIYPARFEMSDVGTLPLGMLFAFTAIILKRDITLPLIGVVFAVEISSSFIQQWSVRLRKGKRVFLVAPIHHHFEKMGWHETKVTSRLWLAGAVFAFLGMLIALI